MSLIATVLRELMAAGLEGDALVLAVERIEAEAPAPVVAPDAAAERRRAWDRDRKRRKSTISTGIPPDPVESAGVPSKEIPQTPKETQPPNPPSPPKGGSQPPRFSPSKSELDGIWEITPRIARERSSRKDLERSLTAAMRRGHDPEAIRQALLAAYASGSFSGDHAKGVHRLIENDRWQSFTELIEASNVVPLDRDALEARQRAIAEWAEQQAKGAANV